MGLANASQRELSSFSGPLKKLTGRTSAAKPRTLPRPLYGSSSANGHSHRPTAHATSTGGASARDTMALTPARHTSATAPRRAETVRPSRKTTKTLCASSTTRRYRRTRTTGRVGSTGRGSRSQRRTGRIRPDWRVGGSLQIRETTSTRWPSLVSRSASLVRLRTGRNEMRRSAWTRCWITTSEVVLRGGD